MLKLEKIITLIEEIHAWTFGHHINDLHWQRWLWDRYFWLTMNTNCILYVQKCQQCLTHTDVIHVPPYKILSSKIINKWHSILPIRQRSIPSINYYACAQNLHWARRSIEPEICIETRICIASEDYIEPKICIWARKLNWSLKFALNSKIALCPKTALSPKFSLSPKIALCPKKTLSPIIILCLKLYELENCMCPRTTMRPKTAMSLRTTYIYIKLLSNYSTRCSNYNKTYTLSLLIVYILKASFSWPMNII